MTFRRLFIGNYPLLCAIDAYLATLTAPTGQPLQEKGDWRSDIAAGPPASDRSRPWSFRHLSFRPREGVLLPLPPDTMIGAIEYYPPGGAGMGWHTDSTGPGWRIYIGRPLAGVPGETLVQEDSYEDTPGIANAFLVSGKPCDSWHAVRAEGPRISMGIRIPDFYAPTARALNLI